MFMNDWGYIRPETVSSYISFVRKKTDWTYDPGDNSIHSLQLEGVAGIWNRLNVHKLAILADEVGMGKTMQAFGVCALLWNIKPDARIIVLAPNHSVAQNWENEYKTFIESHYKLDDNVVRTEIGRNAIHEPVLCGNLDRMADLAESKWCHFLIGKISSLSYTGAGKREEDWNEKIRLCKMKGEELRQRILESFKTVDLLIIDEAQYFRNKEGDSLRVNTASAFLGEDGEKLADRVLFMTATPNHSDNDDIKNIVSYFDKQMCEQEPGDILRQAGIRRFRRLEGKTKYQYRYEDKVACDFDDQLGELFFGLYQKELTKIAQNENKKFMYGYLEGFESTNVNYGQSDSQSDEEQDEQAEKEQENRIDSKTKQTNDYQRSTDSDILLELAEEYKRYNNRNFPAHPKYTAVTSRVVSDQSTFWVGDEPSNGLAKSLIYVRRIPSVRELTARINYQYDKIFLNKIYAELGALVSNEIPERDNYEHIVREYLGVDNTDEDQDAGEDEDTSDGFFPELESLHLNSQIFDLFRTKNDEESLRNTHASLFRNRFTKDSDPFSLFFQPPPDYQKAGYTEIYQLEGDKKSRAAYFSSAIEARLKENKYIYDLLQRNGSKLKSSDNVDLVLTLWSIYYDLLPRDEKKILDKMDPYQKEGYARFLQQGVLRASPALIEIYCWFIRSQKSGKDGLELYRTFIEIVKENLPGSLLLETIQRVIRQFSVYVEKICGIFKGKDLIKQEWYMFNRQNPCYSCSGSTSNRKRLIQAFNSPFFPNTMVSTSVLQEGVNLQYNCDTVYHYGIAWTPGDNEQRVGRIDRLFSKTERKIKKHDNATLDIYYPYLDNTFDRDQVAAFIQQKYKSEKTLDKCIIPEIDKEITSDASAKVKNWEHYFRKPIVRDEMTIDPYPPSFQDITETYQGLSSKCPVSLKEYWYYLQSTLQEVLNRYFPGYVCFANQTKEYEFPLYELKLTNDRTQPLKIDLRFSSEFSGLIRGTVYYLRFTTPLTNSDKQMENIDQAYQQMQDKFPLAQICRDTSTKTNERIYMRTDLPLFIENEIEGCNIHEIEMGAAITQLVYCADQVEEKSLGGQDLKIENMNDNEISYNNRIINGTIAELPSETISGEHTFFEAKITKVLKNCWDINHNFPFIKTEVVNNSTTLISLPFCAEDLDTKERMLLQRWCDHVIEEVQKS